MNKKKISISLFVLFVLLLWPSSVFAVAGVGIHYGFDYSLSMKSTPYRQIASSFLNADTVIKTIPKIDSILQSKFGSQLTLDTIHKWIQQNSNTASSYAPFLIKRCNWQRNWLNGGGKIYVDIIPFIDAIELSMNFSTFEYLATMKYPTGKLKNGVTKQDFLTFAQTGNYDTIVDMTTYDLTLKNTGLKYFQSFGLTQTPYTRLHFDLTIRKTILGLPPVVNILKIYAGGGPSLHFVTPLLTEQFIADVLNETMKNSQSKMTSLQEVMASQNMGPTILKQLIKEGTKPVFGMHFVAGARIKPPIFPVGFYVDGKFLVPFEALDKNAKEDLSGIGFLINAGLTLGL